MPVLLAPLGSKLRRTAERFEDALAFCRKGGYRPQLAWTSCDYAYALSERNDEGDRA